MDDNNPIVIDFEKISSSPSNLNIVGMIFNSGEFLVRCRELDLDSCTMSESFEPAVRQLTELKW